jgi:hypothetical protein
LRRNLPFLPTPGITAQFAYKALFPSTKLEMIQQKKIKGQKAKIRGV